MRHLLLSLKVTESQSDSAQQVLQEWKQTNDSNLRLNFFFCGKVMKSGACRGTRVKGGDYRDIPQGPDSPDPTALLVLMPNRALDHSVPLC